MILNGSNYSTTVNNVDNITCVFEQMMAACDVSYLPGLQKLIICAHCYQQLPVKAGDIYMWASEFALLYFFKAQGFGSKQVNRHLFEGQANVLLPHIRYI